MPINYLVQPSAQAVMRLLARCRPINDDYRLVRGLLSSGEFRVWDAGQRAEDVIDHRGFIEEMNLDFDEVPADSQFRLYLYPDGRVVLEVPKSGLKKYRLIAAIRDLVG